MTERLRTRAALCLAITLAAGLSLRAAPITTYAGTDHPLGGTGSKTVVFVVDWNDGKTTDSISFGLVTDAATIGDALLEAETASPRFDVNLIRYSFGPFADAFAYDAERTSELAPVTDTAYDSGSGTNGEYTHDFSSGYGGADDHLAFNTPAPTYSPYFSAWTGTQGAEDWAQNSGLGDPVVDGEAYGFAYGDGTLAPNAVPEPELVLLLAAGLSVTVWFRRVFSRR